MPSRLPATPPRPGAHRLEHPFWCDQVRCLAGSGLYHVSAPVTEPSSHDDGEISLARYRLDAHDEEGWLLGVRHDGVVEEAFIMCSDENLDRIPVMRLKLRTMLIGGRIVDTTDTTELPVVR